MLSYSVGTSQNLPKVPSPGHAVSQRKNCVHSHYRLCSRTARSLARDPVRARAQRLNRPHVAAMGTKNYNGGKKPRTVTEIKVGVFAKVSLGTLPQYIDSLFAGTLENFDC